MLFPQAYKDVYGNGVYLNSDSPTSNSFIFLGTPNLNNSVTLILPDNDGDNDQVLTTDGDGNLIWSDKESSTLSTNKYFDAYDATGGVSINSIVTVPFDTERENPDSDIFNLNGGIVTIDLSDKFMFIYRVSVDVTSGSDRSDFICYLESNDGGGWFEVPGFRGHGYNRQSTEGMSTVTIAGIIDVTSGTQFRIRAFRDSGTDNLETIADGSSITIFSIKNSGSGPQGPAGPAGPQGPGGTSSNFLSVYNSSNGGVEASSTPVTIPYNTISNESGTIFELSNSNIILNTQDDFYIQYTVSLDQTATNGNDRTAWASWIEANTGSGFSEVAGTRSTGYSRFVSDGENTAMGQTIYEVTGSTTFRVRAQDISTNKSLEPIANACSFVIYTLRGGEQGPAGGPEGPEGPVGPEGPKGDPGTASDFIGVYNSNAGGVTVNSTPATIPYNSISNESNASGTIFSLSNNQLEISTNDDFMIQYTVTLEQVNGNGRTTWQTWLEQDAGGGFSEVAGTRGSGYSRENNEGENTSMGQTIVSVNGSATFRVRAQDTGSNRDHSPIPNGCSMVIYTLRGGEQGPAGPAGSGTATSVVGVEGNGDNGQIAYWTGGSNSETITGESTLFYDDVNNFLGIGKSSPSYSLDVLDKINVGGEGTSGTFSYYSESGATDYSVNFSASSSMTETTNYIFPNSQGAFNTLLMNDGSGNLFWGTVSSATQSNSGVQGNAVAGQVAYWDGSGASETITGETGFVYDAASDRLGIGVSSPSYNLDVANDVNIGQNGSSGTISLFSENGATDHRISFSSSVSMAEDTDYILPSSQGESNSALMNDGAGNLFWGTGSSVASSLRFPIRFTSTNNITVVEDDSYIICDNDGTTINVNLPAASGLSGKVYFIKKVSPNGASHNVTIVPDGTDEIDGATDYNLTKEYDAVMIISDGISTWHLMSRINN